LLVRSVSKCLEFRWTAGCNFTTKLITFLLTVWSHLGLINDITALYSALVLWKAVRICRLERHYLDSSKLD